MTGRTLDPVNVDEATRREAARLVIRMGRSWLRLKPEDVERGAHAVANDPTYGSEIVRDAVEHAREVRDFAALEAVQAAVEVVRNGWAKACGQPESACPPNGRNAPPPPFAPDRDLIGNMEDKAAPA